MKNGKEIRPNGSVIIKVITERGFPLYYVTDKNLKASPNGPWDYLRNARTDADNQQEKLK